MSDTPRRRPLHSPTSLSLRWRTSGQRLGSAPSFRFAQLEFSDKKKRFFKCGVLLLRYSVDLLQFWKKSPYHSFAATAAAQAAAVSSSCSVPSRAPLPSCPPAKRSNVSPPPPPSCRPLVLSLCLPTPLRSDLVSSGFRGDYATYECDFFCSF